MAVSRRNEITEKDLYAYQNEAEADTGRDYAEYLVLRLEEYLRAKQGTTVSSAATTQSEESSQPAPSSRTSLSRHSEKEVQEQIAETQVTDGVESEDLSDSHVEEELVESEAAENESLNLEDSLTESDVNSAEMSWSEASTQAISEIDEDYWNDWESKDPELEDFNDSNASDPSESEVEIKSESSETISSADDIEISGANISLHYRKQIGREEEVYQDDDSYEERASDGLESEYSGSHVSSTEDEESGPENEHGRRLEDLLLGRQNASQKVTQKITIQVYDTADGAKAHPSIFHFTQNAAATIYASPPIFHPTKPLLVWPIGNNEILFADVSSNTYFTRLLNCTTYNTCHVFVKAHFSPDGTCLHFAALEASQIDTGFGPESTKPNIRLNLQVTTHRLSNRKTTRAPPRLVFRTNLPLGKVSRLNVSSLPYTLTWRANDLYLTTRSNILQVIRIPLFPLVSGVNSVPICYTQSPVFLPRTTLSRNVYYFPPANRTEKGSKNKRDKAMAIIGSHSSMPSQRLVVPRVQVSPPIGVLLDEERDLGGWQCKTNSKWNEDAGATKGAGRLQARFEAFDLREDCDIIPYLF